LTRPVDIDYRQPLIVVGGFQTALIGILVVAAVSAGIFLYVLKWKKDIPEKKKWISKKLVKKMKGPPKSVHRQR
jgi:hypothetical protein